MLTGFYIVLLLFINAFFVAAEFALVKVSGIRIEHLAAEGNLLARLTLQIKSNLEAYLAACQLGITMASLGLGWIGEPAVAALLKPLFAYWELSEESLHMVSFLTGFILFSSLHIVFGEQVPKTYAIRVAEKTAMWSAIPLIVFYWMAFPINWLLNKASSIVLNLIGVREISHVEILTGLEISGLIDVSKDHGAIDNDQAEMLQNLFNLDQRVVHNVMLPRSEINSLDFNATREEIIEVIKASRFSRLPVIDGNWDELKGVVLVRELLVALLSSDNLDLTAFLRPPQLVPESLAIRTLFEMMRNSRNHLAFAVDEFGQIDGLITLEDMLEEMVGEIADESDGELQPFYLNQVDGGWLAHGLVPLHDIERRTGFFHELPVLATTLSGYLMQRLQKIVEVEDVWEEGGFRFSVTRISGVRVDEVRIERILSSGKPWAKDVSGDTQT